ncbi:MAG TPA: hypothetical protein PKV29_03325, partial [Trichococcus flocculiformis]|nr:hypothetical protein [Trichococcus flocculiformis]
MQTFVFRYISQFDKIEQRKKKMIEQASCFKCIQLSLLNDLMVTQTQEYMENGALMHLLFW